MHVAVLLHLQRSLVLLHSLVYVFHPPTVLARSSLALSRHHILLRILQVLLYLVIHLPNLTQFVVLSHTLLTHHVLSLLLCLLELSLHSYFSTHLRLHDLLWHTSVDCHQSLLLLLELLLCNWRFFEVMLLLILTEPFRKLVMILKTVSAVGGIKHLISRSISKHLLGYSKSLSELVNIVIFHFLVFHYLYLPSNILAINDVFL